MVEEGLKSLRWISFDLGWTLIDETRAHQARLDAACRQLARIGRRHSVSEFFEMCERAAFDFAPNHFRGMLERLSLADDEVASVLDSARHIQENEAPYSGVSDLLSTLSKRFHLGVISNQPEGAERRLARWGIREHFCLIVSSHEHGLAKPDPRIFEVALSRARCEADEALMVGDRLDNDIGPAKSHGIRTLRVLQGFARSQEPRFSHEVPDISISGIAEFLADEGIRRLVDLQR